MKFISFTLSAIIATFSFSANAVEANFDNVFHYYIQQNPELLNDDYFVESYAKYQVCSDYLNKTRNEFSKKRFLSEMKQTLAENTEKAEKPTSFKLLTKAKFGGYDFDKKSFPFKPIPLNAQYTMPFGKGALCRDSNPNVPHNYIIEVENGGIISELKIEDQALAEKITKYRYNGLMVNAEMEITEIDPNNLSKKYIKKQPLLKGKITNITISTPGSRRSAGEIIKSYDEQQIASLTDEMMKREAEKPSELTAKNVILWKDKLKGTYKERHNSFKVQDVFNFKTLKGEEGNPDGSVIAYRNNEGEFYEDKTYKVNNMKVKFIFVNGDEFNDPITINSDLIVDNQFSQQLSGDFYLRPIAIDETYQEGTAFYTFIEKIELIRFNTFDMKVLGEQTVNSQTNADDFDTEEFLALKREEEEERQRKIAEEKEKIANLEFELLDVELGDEPDEVADEFSDQLDADYEFDENLKMVNNGKNRSCHFSSDRSAFGNKLDTGPEAEIGVKCAYARFEKTGEGFFGGEEFGVKEIVYVQIVTTQEADEIAKETREKYVKPSDTKKRAGSAYSSRYAFANQAPAMVKEYFGTKKDDGSYPFSVEYTYLKGKVKVTKTLK